MEGYGIRVLVAEDDHHLRFLLCSLFECAGYTVVPAGDGLAALEELRRRHFDVVIADNLMPRLTGLELIARLKTHVPWVPVILVSATIPEDVFRSECRPFACVRKPYDNAHLLELVRAAAEAASRAASESPDRRQSASDAA